MTPTIVELVAQLPLTDKELQAQQQQAAANNPDSEKKEEKKAPPADPKDASKFTGPDPEQAKQLASQVFAGGKKGVRTLLTMVHAPGEEGYEHYRAEYLLHTLVIFAGQPEKNRERKLLINSLTDELSSKKRSVEAKLIFIRELQWLANSAAVTALGRLLMDEELCVRAIDALLAIGEGASAQLRKALPKATGRGQLAIAQAVGVMCDKQSAVVLRNFLKHENEDVQLAGAWALARIGDAASVDNILELQKKTRGYARNKAVEAALLMAESLATKGDKKIAGKIYASLRDAATDPKERYLQEAASRCLAELNT